MTKKSLTVISVNFSTSFFRVDWNRWKKIRSDLVFLLLLHEVFREILFGTNISDFILPKWTRSVSVLWVNHGGIHSFEWTNYRLFCFESVSNWRTQFRQLSYGHSHRIMYKHKHKKSWHDNTGTGEKVVNQNPPWINDINMERDEIFLEILNWKWKRKNSYIIIVIHMAAHLFCETGGIIIRITAYWACKTEGIITHTIGQTKPVMNVCTVTKRSGFAEIKVYCRQYIFKFTGELLQSI